MKEAVKMESRTYGRVWKGDEGHERILGEGYGWEMDVKNKKCDGRMVKGKGNVWKR